MKRREILKGLVTLPLVGALAYGAYQRNKYFEQVDQEMLDDIQLDLDPLPEIKAFTGKPLKIGIIGCGLRMKYILKSLGYVSPETIDEYRKKAETDEAWERFLNSYLNQPELGVEITALCDVFDVNAELGIRICENKKKQGTAEFTRTNSVKRYSTYQELISSEDVDAVIIATPDHMHAPISIAAAQSRKHIYCEKPFSWSLAETYALRDQIKKNDVVFQLGHQNRQIEAYNVAAKLIKKNVLGKVSLIEVTTNRNSKNGAWVYPIHKEANPNNIDWKQFIGQAPWHDFDLKRFFRWRCWWDYSTGLSGDLFTHDYDAMNQIMDLDIPASAMASGGIYYHKDGRTVPDTLNMSFEFDKQELSLLYSATQSSSRKRGRMIMGHDASMKVDQDLKIYIDRDSTKYKDKIEKGLIDPSQPMFTYSPGAGELDAITSATERYFAGRGLMFTNRSGKQYDTTFLHLHEWLNCIRDRSIKPSCDIDRSFEEGITALMGTISYKEGRRIYWDAEKESLI
ncbi:MAG: oxidoreductase [Bacteroidetes bacterium]|nr:oxidoreductase [Bacteroidota bacterium]